MKISLSSWKLKFRQLPKYQRIATYLVLLYGLYLVLLGLALPAVLEKQLPEKLSDMLGREVSVGEIHINPFLLRVDVNNFAVANVSEEQTGKLFSFSRLEAQVEFWRSLTTLVPTVKDIVLTRPSANIAYLNGEHGNEFNFTGIVNRLSSESAPEKPEAEQKPESAPSFRAQRIAIVDGSANYSDRVQQAQFSYHKIDLELTALDIATILKSDAEQDQAPVNQLTFSAQSHDDQSVLLQGQFQLFPLLANANLTLNQFDLTDIWPYVRDQIKAKLDSGILTANATLHVNQKDESLTYSVTPASVTIDQLSLSDNTHPKLTLATLGIDGINVQSADNSVTVNNISLNRLHADAVLNPQGLDLADLFTPASSEAPSSKTTAPASAQSTPWLVSVKKVDLNGSVALRDNSFAKGEQWQVAPVKVELRNIFSDFHKPVDYQWSLEAYSRSSSAGQTNNSKHSGALTGKGQVDLSANSLSSHLAMTNFDLTALRPYLTPYANIKLNSGYLSTEGDITSAWQSGKADFNGSLKVNTLAINDPVNNEPLLSWQSMKLSKIAYSMQNNALSVGRVDLLQPYAKVTINKDHTTNIGDITSASASNNAQKEQDIAANEPQTTGTPSSPTSAPLNLSIGSINIDDGSTYFSDFSLTPSFSSSIRSLQGSISEISSASQTPAKVELQGKIDQYAPIRLSGEINPLQDEPYLDLVLDIKNAELTSVNPYSGTYAGYYIDKGQMSLTLQYYLDKGLLKGANHVNIDQLKLGKPSNSNLATDLPVKLAIALLQDRDGVIALGVDVSGDVNDPSFGFGNIIWNAVKNIVTKAVTAPFSLLANLVGSDEQLDKVTFAAGQSVIRESEYKRLQILADALNKRPQLTVNAEGSMNPAADASVLAEQALKQQLGELGVTNHASLTASYISGDETARTAVATLYTRTLNQSVEEQRKIITDQLTTETQPADAQEVETRLYATMYNQLLNAQVVSPEQLQSLALDRAKNVKSYLVNRLNIDPARVFLLSGRKANSGQSEVRLTLDAK